MPKPKKDAGFVYAYAPKQSSSDLQPRTARAIEDYYFNGSVDQNNIAALNLLNNNPDQQERLIRLSLLKTIKKLQKACKNNPSGTTFCGVFFFNNKAYFVNVGDSMAFVWKQNEQQEWVPTLENTLQNAQHPREQYRVRKAGGYIEGSPHQERVGGVLEVTRSIGPFAKGGANYEDKKPILEKTKDTSARLGGGLAKVRQKAIMYSLPQTTTEIYKGVTSIPEIFSIPMTTEMKVMLTSDGFDKSDRQEPNPYQFYLEEIQKKTKLKNKPTIEEAVTQIMERYLPNMRSRDDTTVLLFNYQNNQFFGVCDGHGGPKSAQIVSQNFATVFNQQLLYYTNLEEENNPVKQWITNGIQNKQEPNANNQTPETTINSLVKMITDCLRKIPIWYHQLHPIMGNKDDWIDTLLTDTNNINDPLDKLFYLIKYLKNTFIHQTHPQDSSNQKKMIKEKIDFLNTHPADHHYQRLIGLLLQYIAKELNTLQIEKERIEANNQLLLRTIVSKDLDDADCKLITEALSIQQPAWVQWMNKNAHVIDFFIENQAQFNALKVGKRSTGAQFTSLFKQPSHPYQELTALLQQKPLQQEPSSQLSKKSGHK